MTDTVEASHFESTQNDDNMYVELGVETRAATVAGVSQSLVWSLYLTSDCDQQQ